MGFIGEGFDQLEISVEKVIRGAENVSPFSTCRRKATESVEIHVPNPGRQRWP